VDDCADSGIDGDQPFCFELSKRYVDGPLAGSDCAQAVGSETNAFSYAHASVAEKKQCVAGEVIAPLQFLLDEFVLLRSQRPWQTMLLPGNIVTPKQMCEGRQLLSPGEFFQHASKIHYIYGECLPCRWRIM